jgi:transposase
MFVVLHTYATKHLCRTIRSMVSRYAPLCENDTESYIRRVCRRTHLEADTPLDTLDGQTMIDVVAAMSEVENGTTAVRRDVIRGWQLFFDDFGTI